MRGVYDGLNTRNLTLRGAALGGILLGLEELKEEFDARVGGSRVEVEVVVAFAELFDALNTGDDWETPSTKNASSCLTHHIFRRLYSIGRQYQLDTVFSLETEIFPAVREQKSRAMDLRVSA